MLVLLPVVARAQAVQVRAFADRTTVGRHQTVTFTLEVRGKQLSDVQQPEPPATQNLERLSAVPNTRQQLSFRNGQTSRSLSYSWTYRPQAMGDARIGAASVRIGDDTYRTEPIELRITAQPPARGPVNPAPDARDGGPGADELFIDVEVSDRNVYLNEPVRLTYRLFFAPDLSIRQSRLAGSWEAEGFWREELNVQHNPLPEMVVRRGRRYRSIVLKRMVLYPTRTGELEIAPLRITSEVFDGSTSQDPFSRFFSFGKTYEDVVLASPSVRVNVRALPEEAPPSFHGAVGYYDMDAEISRHALETGGATELRVQISGRGYLSALEAPLPTVPEAFDVYDPKVSLTLDRSGRMLLGTRTFTYALVAQQAGSYTLPPVTFTYFNPAAERFETLRSDSLRLRVAPGAAASNPGAPPVDEEMMPMHEVGTWRATAQTPLYRQMWIYGALLAPWLALLGLLIYTRRRRYAERHPGAIRRRTAHARATEELERCEREIQRGEIRRGYGTLEEVMRGFLEDHLGRPLGGLTRRELEARLERAGVAAAQRRSLATLLDAAEQAQFAPAASTDPAADLTRARNLLEELDANRSAWT